MADLALGPVSVAVYRVLRDATLQTLTPGGWHEDVPQAPTYPYGWFEVRERETRGFGAGGLPEVELRTHVKSQVAGMAEAQAINARLVTLLKDAALTVTGYTHCGHVFYDETIRQPDEEVGGKKVKELVSLFRIYVEEMP